MPSFTPDQIRASLIQAATSLNIITQVMPMVKKHIIVASSPALDRASRYESLQQFVKHLRKSRMPTVKQVELFPVDGKTMMSARYQDDVRLSKSGYLKILGADNQQYYFSLTKPNKLSFSLKPAALKLTNQEYTWQEYQNAVMTGIEQHQNIPDMLSVVLKQTFHQVVKNIRTPIPPDIMMGYKMEYQAAMNTEFGEVLGPAIMRHAQLWPSSLTMKTLHFPSSQTTSLYDFSITLSNNDVYYCSSKAVRQGNVNTVKPQSVIDMLSRPAKTPELQQIIHGLKKSTEYHIMELLANNSAKQGPLEVLKQYPEYFSLKKEVSDHGEAMSIIEKHTRSHDASGKMFGKLLGVGAANFNVYFVKFSLSLQGSITTGVQSPTMLEEERKSYLRSKGRDTGERMGLEPY